MNTAQILNPSILVKPSKELKTYISEMKIDSNMPDGVKSLILKNNFKKLVQNQPSDPKYLTTEDDLKFIKSLKLKSVDRTKQNIIVNEKLVKENEKLLNIQDLHWIYNYINERNKTNEKKVYLHELLEHSDIILPKNSEVPRNEELDKRCKRLKAEQENMNYQKMTKDVDNLRRRFPEDTISYQLKQINRHLIAIFQFIVSVAAGFAFGFIGVELIIGSLDFGFRLLLGIICALIIALAELYFLAKRLNEDLQFEYHVERQNKQTKID